MKNETNFLIMLADDMGYSDIGCFGSEIKTPHLDQLAQGGVRMTNMRNCARCCPTRASLLTGSYPHQAGIGAMTRPHTHPAYQGWLRDDVATTAEVLKEAGYATWCSGKWHVGGDYAVHNRDQWNAAGDERHPLPTQRGFERYYGTLCGAGSYFQPPCMMDQDSFVETFPEDYHYTDATAAHACNFIDEAVASERPFYGYCAFTAPHWPLHATEEDIAAYRGQYDGGWDALRRKRFQALQSHGLISADTEISPRDEKSYHWEDAEHPQWEAERMAVYAAQITQMDRGIGAIIDRIKAHGIFEDTVLVFISDNGGCAEYLREDGDAQAWPEIYSLPTNRGTMCKVGNRPHIMPGPAETFMSYDLPWANASNVPFKKFKAWTHEGGMATPCVVHWPNGNLPANAIQHGFGHIMDLAATIEDACGLAHPTERAGVPLQPLAGRSLLPLWRDEQEEVWTDQPVCWEHYGHAAVRLNGWKLVRTSYEGPWELYNLNQDPTELTDLSATYPEKVTELSKQWDEWSAQVGVLDAASYQAGFYP